MKRILLVCVFILIASSALSMEDRIVAVVNNEIVTSSDIESFVSFLYMQMSSQYNEKELQEKIQTMIPDILIRLIEDRLLIQEAKKEDIRVDENRIKFRIAQMKKNYPSEEVFLEDLDRNGLTLDDIESKIREQLLMFDLVDMKIRSQITVNPQDVTNFYNAHKDEFIQPETRRVIAIRTESEEEIKEFLSKLKEKTDFETAAGELNLEIENLGFVSKEQLKEELDRAVFELKLDRVSSVIKIGDKFYVIKLKEIIPAKQKTLDEVKEIIANMLLEEKMQVSMTEWLDELKEKSYIEIKEN